MPVSVDHFWKLLAASELFSPSDVGDLSAEFAQLKGVSDRASSKLLAEWLVSAKKLTRYQADVLLAGRPGPFVFGPFTITERLAGGRLGGLFRASFDGKQTVFLVPLAQLTDDADDYPQLGELAARAATVTSPHVSRSFRATRQRGQAFIATEALAGKSLVEAIHGKKFSVPTACQLGVQVALGLVALHEAKLTHGSIAPQNIWVTPQGTLKILQFPLVAAPRRAPRFEMPLVDYVAPEWIESPDQSGPLVDLYSLGALMYELLAGRPPFPGGTPRQKLARHRSELSPRIDKIAAKVPEDLAILIEDLLAKDPILRCQTAAEAAQILGRFAGGGGGRGAPPPGSGQLMPGYGATRAPAWQAPPQEHVPQKPKPTTNRGAAQPAAVAQDEPQQPDPAPQGKAPRKAAEAPLVAPPGQQTELAPANEEAAISPAIVLSTDDDETRDQELRPFVVTEPSESSVRRPPPSRSPLVLWSAIGLGAVAILMGIGAIVWLNRPAAPGIAKPESSSPQPVQSEPPKEAESLAPVDAADDNLVDDDGQTLWESPTAGPALELRYLPNAAQVIFALRPAELLAHAEGPKLLAALGPAGSKLLENLQAVLGVDPAAIEQLIIAFAADESFQPRAAYRMRLAEEVPRAELLAAWGNPAVAKASDREYFARDGLAYYLPLAESTRVVAIAPERMMQELLEQDGNPLLRSGIEKLASASDADRLLTLLVVPGFLFTDGRTLLAGPLAELKDPLRDFLGQDFEALLLSAHLDEDLYVELRTIAPVGRKPLELLGEVRARWERLPNQVETHLEKLTLRPHGAALVERLPVMLKSARDFTRYGVDDRQIVMAAYLPVVAAHNLLMGSELALLEGSGAEPAESTGSPPTKPRAAATALAQPVTLSFPRETLEGALGILAREIGIPIVISGNDLQLEGITRNQSLNDFEERDQPAAEVIRKLLLLANPGGKLVYQVKADKAGAETLYVTTRAAVNRRGEQPAEGF